MDAKAKKLRIWAQSNMGQNGEIQLRRRALSIVKMRGRRSEEAVQAKAELQRAIWKSTSCMWTDYLLKLNGGEVRQVANIASHQEGATMDALTDRVESQETLSPTRKSGHTKLLPNKQRRAVLQATPSRASAGMHNQALSQTSLILAIGQECPWP